MSFHLLACGQPQASSRKSADTDHKVPKAAKQHDSFRSNRTFAPRVQDLMSCEGTLFRVSPVLQREQL